MFWSSMFYVVCMPQQRIVQDFELEGGGGGDLL